MFIITIVAIILCSFGALIAFAMAVGGEDVDTVLGTIFFAVLALAIVVMSIYLSNQ